MSDLLLAYKIFDIDRNGGPRTLFHGLNGSRSLPVGTWLTATQTMVRDGSGQDHYVSGFHAYRTVESVVRWARAVTRTEGRYACMVGLCGCRDKPRAVRETILADRMLITSREWDGRVALDALLRGEGRWREEAGVFLVGKRGA